jgi:hypothetical protein
MSVANTEDVPNQKVTNTKLRKNDFIPGSTFTVVDKLSPVCDKTETVKLNFVLRNTRCFSIYIEVGARRESWNKPVPPALFRRTARPIAQLVGWNSPGDIAGQVPGH